MQTAQKQAFCPIIEFILPKIHDNSQRLIPENNQNEKSAQRRRKHCALAVVRRSQKFPLAADPLPGGMGRPKFNQLDMVAAFTCRSGLVKVNVHFELSW